MRLIDADVFREGILAQSITGKESYPTELICDFVDEQTTIEAVPVVHGEWIYENYTWHCDQCGFHPFKGYIPETPGFNFCPNCGCDMRKMVEE